MIVEVKEVSGVNRPAKELKRVYLNIDPSFQIVMAISITFILPPDVKENSAGTIETKQVSATWIYTHDYTEISGSIKISILTVPFRLFGKGTTLSIYIQVKLGAMEIFTSVNNNLKIT